MPSLHQLRSGFLLPADIDIAQRAFDRICAQRAMSASSDEAAEVAASVIAFFQQGIIAEDELVATVSTLISSRSAVAA